MRLSLVRGDAVFSLVLPERCQGRYWVTYRDGAGRPVETVSIDGVEGKWVLRSNRSASILDSDRRRLPCVTLEAEHFYEIIVEESGEVLLLRSEPSADDRKHFTRFLLPTRATIKIGRGDDCHIRFANKFVSANHAELSVSQGRIHLRDADSANGTFVNGKRAHSQELAPGDVILVVGLLVVVGRGFIAVNDPGGMVKCDTAVLKPMAQQQVDSEEEETEDSRSWCSFHRSPRTMSEVVPFSLRVDPPPSPDNTEDMPTVMLVGPALTMGMSSVLMGAFALMTALRPGGGGFSSALPTMLMSFTMVGGMILWPVLSKRYERRNRARREQERRVKYGEYLQAAREALVVEQSRQGALLRGNNVTVSQCATRVLNREPGLWERTPEHGDFLSVCLGTGDVPMALEMQPGERRFSVDKDDLAECYYDLVTAPWVLSDVPIAVSLRENAVLGMVGERQRVVQMVEDLVLQLVALHSYDELKLAFVYGEGESGLWDTMRWLPHVWNENETARLVASTPLEAKELSTYLDHEVSARAARRSDADAAEGLSHVVVFALDRQSVGRVEAINRILRERIPGFTVVAAYDEYQALPKECRAVIEVGETGLLYDPLDKTGRRVEFVEDSHDRVDMRLVARTLANTRVEARASSKALPDAVAFLEMLSAGRVEHLNAPARWAENNPVLSLEAPLGVSAGGEPFKLDIHEKYHGPHGLIAGMTGSGKSELIMTYILSLALNYHPHELAFVLIDYKGGGMANAFADLPHVAGTITNLDGAAVTRSLVSLQSELKRRQTIFNEAADSTGMSNIDIYKYQSLYRDGVVSEPLPHLLVISDEFAELKAQQPDFMDQLVSAARIGRSLGVHLILATQKPSGVVDDQIWSNSRFRICLKVQDAADSMEVIKRPDAAALATTGRFYVQVGSDELFDLGQSAWSGAPYHAADRAGNGYDDSVVLMNKLGQPLRQVRQQAASAVAGRAPKQLDAIVAYITELADEEGVRTRSLWLDPIPGVICLADVQSRHEYSYDVGRLDALVGTYDDPQRQRQDPMTLRFTGDGNVLVYGAAGSGKTTFVTTTLYSLMTGYTPEDVHIYILDFGAETLRAFQSAPHVGNVVFSNDAERIESLFSMLKAEISRRKGILADTGGDYASYRAEGGKEIPALLVVVHNYAAFSEMYEEHEDHLAYLTREGTKYGLYFMLTASTSTSVRYRVQQNFKQVIVLQMNDATEYGGILGNTGGVVPSKLPGRGLFRSDVVYEFQTALVSPSSEGEFGQVRRVGAEIDERWSGIRAKHIPVLPERVTPTYLRDEIKSTRTGHVPVGVDKASLSVVHYPFAERFITPVISQADERLPFMAALAELLAAQEGAQVTVIDPGELLTPDLRPASAPRLRYVHEFESASRATGDLFAEMLSRHKRGAPQRASADRDGARQYFIVPSLSELRVTLNAQQETDLLEMLERCDASLGVSLIIGDTSGAMAAVAYEPWAKRNIEQGTGIFIGDGLTDQFIIQPAISSADYFKAVGRDFGYVLGRGRATLAKMLVSDSRAVSLDE